MLTLMEMGKKNNHGKTKNHSNLSQDVLYSNDVPLDVEAMLENGITNTLLNLKNQNINQI